MNFPLMNVVFSRDARISDCRDHRTSSLVLAKRGEFENTPPAVHHLSFRRIPSDKSDLSVQDRAR
jgi:hypothetical protein